MDAAWYYVRGGVQNGPVSFDDLKAAAAANIIAATDLVWKEGTADWVPARSVPGLFVGPPPVPTGPVPEPLPLDDHRPNRPPRQPGGGVDVVALAQEFFRRAVTANPGAIAPNPAEVKQLTQSGVTDPIAARIAVWRRAVLWVALVPTGFAALLGFIDVVSMEKDETEHLSNFGVMLLYLQTFSLFALPVAAVMGALTYDRLRLSARWVVIGGVIALGVPVAVAFAPNALVLNKDIPTAGRLMVQFMMGLMFYLTLTPTVLSLLPAVSRGCLRVKSFLPQSLAPGWGLVASVPLFVLLTLATFVLLYKFVGNLLLIFGLLCWIGAPLLYLTKVRLLTRPLSRVEDMKELASTQLLVLALAAFGVLLIVIYLFTAEFNNMTLVGFDKSDSLIRPWDLDLHRVWIEFIGRSLFMTVLFADIMMRMALSVWREERGFAGTPGAAEFDKAMTGLTAAVETK